MDRASSNTINGVKNRDHVQKKPTEPLGRKKDGNASKRTILVPSSCYNDEMNSDKVTSFSLSSSREISSSSRPTSQYDLSSFWKVHNRIYYEKFGEHHQIAAKTLPNNGLLNMYASSSRGATGSRHSALQTGGLGPTGRKRPREALRDFPIPTSAAFFGAVAPTWKIDSTPKRLHYLDNEGKITSRLFSPARKLDYSKRRRLSRTPSPASSSHGEMDPDSPTFLKMKRIEARHAQLHEANIPRPVPAQADHGDLFQKPRQPPQPVYSSRYSYKTPNPMPNETKDDADMPGLTGIIHFSAPGRNASVEFSDDEGILYFKPWDVEDEVMAGEETGSYDNPVVVEDETASEGEDEEDGYSFGPMLYMGTEV